MSESATTAEPEKAGAFREVFEAAKTVVYALLIAVVLKTVVFQPFTIPSASMEPNLYQGDYLVVSKFSYGWSHHSIPFSPPIFKGRILDRTPERGDIVVFKLPRDGHTDYIKRIIGLPGDRVQMKADRLYVNDMPAPRREETAIQGVGDNASGLDVEHFRETLPGGRSYLTNDFGPGGELDDTEVFVVPAGHYFVMGDNRDNSQDSRLPAAIGVGFVPAENLVGKAQIVLGSWGPGMSLFKPWTWVTEARWGRFVHGLY
ncbi:MAG: signal peptidase I [Phenylobacterium sp.]|uniref:signal peptidase I n=1 Tax=Phenylobacterium sp. TaxID=1871053 RepID=UPI00273607EF|nr:signal peptidase I [Phenylobacterium sp.]MDP3173652.1 signal peptidase I [Phenylobacterium sp.]